MATHQASQQMLGYLYQVRYALKLLLENDNSDYRISIEKFDDVAFDENGTPKELIQLKHHIGNAGALSDNSVDLWRTLKVWMDMLQEDPNIVYHADFFLITTSSSPTDSAASKLHKSNRDIPNAYLLLKNIAKTSANAKNKAAYDAFIKLSEKKAQLLLNHIIVIDNADNIIDSEKSIRNHIKYCCKPSHEDFIYEQLEGWWFQQSIAALCSDKPRTFSQNDIRNQILDIKRQYDEDNLPIDQDLMSITKILEDQLTQEQKIFLEQLRLLSLRNSLLDIALLDYYRAFQQRSRWIRNDLLYTSELAQYEQRLVETWKAAFEWKKDDIEDFGEAITEEQKVKAGKELYRDISGKDIRIRKNCDQPFVMRGSYHILANSMKVGWHMDFVERLQELLI